MKRPTKLTAHALAGAVLLASLTLAVPARSFPQQSNPAQVAPEPASQPSSAQQSGPLQNGPAQNSQSQNGTIQGLIVDPTGNPVSGAHVTLTRADQTQNEQVQTGDDGQFFLTNVAPGAFQLTITAPGLSDQAVSGTLQAGEAQNLSKITLTVAEVVTEVRVSPQTQEQIAEAEVKQEEKQRVLGVVPNFYVEYDPSAMPLTSKQKFELAWRSTLDPVTFGLVGAAAGIQQAEGVFSGYGQGAQGYGKRYGANFADAAIGTMIGGYMLPSLLKQDPRYFYKGTGTIRSRILYALANAVICKGDNRKWQPNYSGVLGSIAAGGISNLYYPQANRGVALTFENAFIGIGETAGANVLQEFVIRRLTPKASHSNEASP